MNSEYLTIQGRLIETIKWDLGLGDTNTLLYAACFNPTGEYIAAGGSEGNETRVFHRQSGKCLARLQSTKRAVYSVDFSPDSAQVCLLSICMM